MIKHLKTDDGVSGIVAVSCVHWSLVSLLGSQDECFLGFVKTGLGLGWPVHHLVSKLLSKGGLRSTMETHCENLSDCKLNYGDQSEASIVVT